MKFNRGKCFLAGTQILMSDTTAKYIEDIEVGDEIKSCKLRHWNTYIRMYDIVDSVVTKLIREVQDDIVKLKFGSDGQSTYIVIENTFDHPFYVKGKGWCSYKPELTAANYDLNNMFQIRQLEIGDICHQYDADAKLKDSAALTSIEENIENVQTYSFEIDINSAIFANNILVHTNEGVN